MADFELEQLATLLDRLGDRLDDTEGDGRVVAELSRIRQILSETARAARSTGNTAPQNPLNAERRNARTIIDELFNRWHTEDPLKDLRKQRSQNSSSGAETKDTKGATIIAQLRREQEQAAGGAAATLRRFSGAVKDSTEKLITRFSALDGSAKGLATALGAGVIGKATAGWLDKNTDAYRDLIRASEGSVSSFMDMRKTAGAAMMDVATLGKAMREGSSGVKLLGAKDWSKFNKSVRDATLSTGLMGMTTDEMINAQSDYLEMLRNMGDLNNLNTDEQNRNFQKLISTSQEMAGILGKTRDDQLKAVKEQSLDYDMTSVMDSANMSRDSVLQMQTLMSSFKDIDPQLEKTMKEIFVGGGPQSEASINMVAAGGEMTQDLMQRMMDARESGTMTPELVKEILSELKQNAIAAKKNTDLNGQIATIANRGAAGLSNISQVMNKSIDLDFDKSNPDQSKQKDPATVAILGVEEASNRVAATMQNLVNSVLGPMLDKFGPGMKALVEAVIKYSDKISALADTLGTSFPNTMTAIGIAALGLLGGFKLLGGVIRPIIGLFGLLSKVGGKLPGGLGKLAGGAAIIGKMLGRKGVANATGAAAGAAGTRQGGTIIGELLSKMRGSGAVGTAGAAATAATAGAAKANAEATARTGILGELIKKMRSGEKLPAAKPEGSMLGNLFNKMRAGVSSLIDKATKPAVVKPVVAPKDPTVGKLIDNLKAKEAKPLPVTKPTKIGKPAPLPKLPKAPEVKPSRTISSIFGDFINKLRGKPKTEIKPPKPMTSKPGIPKASVPKTPPVAPKAASTGIIGKLLEKLTPKSIVKTASKTKVDMPNSSLIGKMLEKFRNVLKPAKSVSAPKAAKVVPAAKAASTGILGKMGAGVSSLLGKVAQGASFVTNGLQKTKPGAAVKAATVATKTPIVAKAMGAAGKATGMLGNTGKAITSTVGKAGAAIGKTGIGGVAKTAGKGLLKSGLGFGAAIESLDYIFGDKKLTMKNMAKSGLALGGGAIGGVMGSALGPLGSIAGGAGGYMGGQALGDWLLGKDDLADATKPKDKPKPIQKTDSKNQTNQNQANKSTTPVQQPVKPADATKPKSSALTLDQMTNKILDSNILQAEHLKKIRESNDEEVRLMREELTMMRSYNDRIIRLLEEGNKNTRNINDLSA